MSSIAAAAPFDSGSVALAEAAKHPLGTAAEYERVVVDVDAEILDRDRSER